MPERTDRNLGGIAQGLPLDARILQPRLDGVPDVAQTRRECRAGAGPCERGARDSMVSAAMLKPSTALEKLCEAFGSSTDFRENDLPGALCGVGYCQKGP